MRSIWNGSISFGLVSIPVKLFSGSEEDRIDLNMLDRRDQAQIRYKRVNENTGKEVEWKDIVKGFKKDDRYIILEDEDFEKANIKKSKTIDIQEFVNGDEIADVLFKKPYFLEPQKNAEKSYQLLYQALKKTKKFGVATFVMRQKEHLCLIGLYKNAMALYLIRFAHEIRNPEDLKIPDTTVSEKELGMAVSLIREYTTKFEFDKYKDVYNEQLMAIINKKSAGEEIKSEDYTDEPTEAGDLLSKLKASLEKKKKAS